MPQMCVAADSAHVDFHQLWAACIISRWPRHRLVFGRQGCVLISTLCNLWVLATLRLMAFTLKFTAHNHRRESLGAQSHEHAFRDFGDFPDIELNNHGERKSKELTKARTSFIR